MVLLMLCYTYGMAECCSSWCSEHTAPKFRIEWEYGTSLRSQIYIDFVHQMRECMMNITCLNVDPTSVSVRSQATGV
jgi:hypothetical protein